MVCSIIPTSYWQLVGVSIINNISTDTHHVIITGPAILIAALSAGIFHDDYGIYDDNQRKV